MVDRPAAEPGGEPPAIPAPPGALVETVPDPTGAFYVRLGQRYGHADQQPPPDRVILVMSIDKVATKWTRAHTAS